MHVGCLELGQGSWLSERPREISKATGGFFDFVYVGGYVVHLLYTPVRRLPIS